MQKHIRISLLAMLICASAAAQKSDFIVLKSRSNRTLRTYFEGTHLSARTYNDFRVNGPIKAIRNDSIFVQQTEVYQVPSQFGTPILDTVVYTIGFPYTDIKTFDYNRRRRRGFSQIKIPTLMILAGSGYLVLETVNGIYRKESFNDQGKLLGMGIAAAVAAAGFTWKHLQKLGNKAGGKYKVVYVNQ
jgi:hypothetical protein